MRFVILAENTTIDPRCRCGHGLSIYGEVNGHAYLFDMGPDEMFVENARQLGVDLTKVEVGLLSHGHWDHGGGIGAFLACNADAPVYMRSSAIDDYVARSADGPERYIGIDREICRQTDRIRYLDRDVRIDDAVYVFSDIRTADLPSQTNSTLMRREQGGCMPDDFRHEQNYLITDGKIAVLLAGCAHRGIVNIMQRSAEILGRAPDYVIGGFHLQNPDSRAQLPASYLETLAEKLLSWDTIYYTGHCTGSYAFEDLEGADGGAAEGDLHRHDDRAGWTRAGVSLRRTIPWMRAVEIFAGIQFGTAG